MWLQICSTIVWPAYAVTLTTNSFVKNCEKCEVMMGQQDIISDVPNTQYELLVKFTRVCWQLNDIWFHLMTIDRYKVDDNHLKMSFDSSSSIESLHAAIQYNSILFKFLLFFEFAVTLRIYFNQVSSFFFFRNSFKLKIARHCHPNVAIIRSFANCKNCFDFHSEASSLMTQIWASMMNHFPLINSAYVIHPSLSMSIFFSTLSIRFVISSSE